MCRFTLLTLFLLLSIATVSLSQMLQPRVHLPLAGSITKDELEKVICGDKTCLKNDCVVRFNKTHAYLKCVYAV
ncbi:hypothetical protein PFISCL1PPCAC_8793 [Pristionchus fissidentatus]|uniref:Uncharacterized protein n=1 Tax=Pristionchus fissidentatus TaxID=1538716 RepID=A0AAV5VFN5_9BILA|nr:hypothetical protein PFISCL1PPCAC_8793 [Pristionchus fissidentatus]